jgi:hypothetical protein
VLQLFEGFTEPHEQTVKHPSHVAQLVVWIIDRNSLIEPLRRDLLCLPRHVFERIKRLTCDAIARESRYNQGCRHSEQEQSNEFKEARPERFCTIGQPN